MINFKSVTNLLVATALLCGTVLLGPSAANASEATVAEGKKLAFNRKKGNCLACHAIEGGALPGNIGPPLVAMKARFPDAAVLRAQIWNASAANPDTIMPPFGRHQILSDDEIDKITAFIHTL